MTLPHILHHPVAGGTIGYAWSHGGNPHPLVMLHGLGDSAIITFRDRLARSPLADTPTLFIDLPGFGESTFTIDHPATIDRYADDIADLLHALRIPSTITFGHSMGANIGIALANRHPSLVDQLILAEPLLHAELSVLASEIARHDEHTFVSRRYTMLVRATSLQAQRGDIAATAFLEPLRCANPTTMYRAAQSLIDGASATLRTLTHGTTCPCTLIMGAHTNVDPRMLGLTQIPIIRIPNSGHFMMVEQEIATTYAILEAMT